ncbi:MAG TPA: response regulator [Solirubrobacteraceae bacterium]|nr:response regulator [Solirubrobacteraceae bacterium]
MATVLLADDHPTMRLLVRRSLEEAGYDVIEAVDGLQAFELAIEHRPTLIFLDWQMPGLTGLDVCKRLRVLPEFASTAVIMMTGFAELAMIQIARDAGADDVLVKPVEPQVLLACTERVLQPEAA